MNNNEKEIVVKNNTNEVIQVTDDLIVEYMEAFGIAKELKEEQKKQFIHVAKSFQLNPFKREIYCIPYGNTLTIIVGYETYLKRAERSGKLAGWKVWTEGKLEDRTIKAICEIWRKDWTTSFRHEVYYSEYERNTNIWREKPYTMIKKVAIAQAFRLAFPDELGGMPYTAEEQWENGIIEKIEHQVVKQEVPIIEVQTEQKALETGVKQGSENTENPQNQDKSETTQEEKKIDNYQIIKNLAFPLDFEIEEKIKKDGNKYWVVNVKISDKKKMKMYLFDTKVYEKINTIKEKMDFQYVEVEKNGKTFCEIVDVVESLPF